MALALLAGCSNYAQPHAPYSPLFSSGGQVEASVSAGTSGPGVSTSLAARAAVAPVDGFLVAAGFAGDPVDEGAGSRHLQGELALGTFLAQDPKTRVEGLAGVVAGYGQGEWSGEDTDGTIEGSFVRPFVQVTAAGVVDGVFTYGGGARLGLTVADLEVVLDDPCCGPSSRVGVQLHIDPFLTLRYRVDDFEIDLTGGVSGSIGDELVGSTLNVFLELTLRARFQAWDPPRPAEPLPPETPEAPTWTVVE